MDLAAPGHYVGPLMQVLLLLTALMSALTGVFAGARADDSRLARAEAPLVAAAEAVAAVPAVVLRPASVLPSVAASAAFVPPPRPAGLPAFALATVRLLE